MNRVAASVTVSIIVVMGLAYVFYNPLTTSFYFNDFIDKIANGGAFLDKPSVRESMPANPVYPVAEKNKKYLCGDNIQNSNDFIREFLIPIPCSQPVGLTVDENNNIWVAADWAGYILVFNQSSNAFVKNISLPKWNSKGTFGSMVWDMEFDNNGDLWFTDEATNSIWKYFTKEDRFEKYKSPTKNSYPSSLAFDAQGRVWFTEVFGKKLGVLNPLEAENNTTNGIREYDLGSMVEFETMGPLSLGFGNNDGNNDTGKDTLWLSSVDFPYGGQIVKFDIPKENFTIYSLNTTKSVPISVAEDDKGMVWTNDHASSLFLMLDPKTGYTKQHSTSPASSRSTPTLPYYNEYEDGKIWFNEHEGNAIASYDLESNTLVEYHIPTRNHNWGNTSNPLQFEIDNNGSVWFTEWTENKLGVIPKEKLNQLPVFVSTPDDSMFIDSKTGKGDNIDVYVHRNNNTTAANSGLITNSISSNVIDMFVASSISKSGKLWNITGEFSKDRFQLSDIVSPENPYKIALEVNPTDNAVPGEYTLTVSARYNNDITVSKMVDLTIT